MTCLVKMLGRNLSAYRRCVLRWHKPWFFFINSVELEITIRCLYEQAPYSSSYISYNALEVWQHASLSTKCVAY